MKKTLILIIALTAGIMTAQETPIPTVNVTGEGIVNVIPDEAIVKIRMESQGNNPAEVKRDNDKVIDAVITFLRSQGIADKHIQSEYINLNKNYDYNRKIYNYSANQALTVTLKDLSNYEQVMSGLLNSGINRIDGVTLSSSALKKRKAEARIKAMQDAKERAELYAGAINQSVGRAITISEQGHSAPQPMYKARMMSMEADSSAGETMAPGELAITVRIQVSFELK